jgi:hypothetical protein
MKRQEANASWFTRREGVIRGPFPAGEITRYILLGRIRLDDELSRDRATWMAARSLTGLLPHEMLSLSSWEDYQRYIEARMQVDERRADRRRDTCPRCVAAPADRRVRVDRRQAESHRMLDWYVFGFQGPHARGNTTAGRLRTLLLTLLLATLVFAWLVPASR